MYQDILGLKRLIETPTVSDFDYIIILDGRYATYSSEPEIEDYDINDIINSSKTNIYYEQVPPMYEPRKRDLMFRIAERLNLDFVAVIDTDEIPVFDKELFELESKEIEDCKCCILVDNYIKHRRHVPRIFNLKCKPYFKRNHSEIYSGNVDVAQKAIDSKIVINSLILTHDKSLHNDIRKENRRKYVKPNIDLYD